MIHAFQDFAIALFILALISPFVCFVIVITRQTDWRVFLKRSWRHPFYVPFILFWNLFVLEFVWVAFGLIIEGFGRSHFMQGFFYNSTLNGMQHIFGVSGCLMIILFLIEEGYVHGLRPLLQKVKAPRHPAD